MPIGDGIDWQYRPEEAGALRRLWEVGPEGEFRKVAKLVRASRKQSIEAEGLASDHIEHR